ncbi:hypothetical protein GCM10011313_28040 [Mycetocola zhadangensis]|nr:hypothetical protein GCM10011313_28040 [Mycetocola zhadangensis]
MGSDGKRKNDGPTATGDQSDSYLGLANHDADDPNNQVAGSNDEKGNSERVEKIHPRSARPSHGPATCRVDKSERIRSP